MLCIYFFFIALQPPVKLLSLLSVWASWSDNVSIWLRCFILIQVSRRLNQKLATRLVEVGSTCTLWSAQYGSYAAMWEPPNQSRLVVLGGGALKWQERKWSVQKEGELRYCGNVFLEHFLVVTLKKGMDLKHCSKWWFKPSSPPVMIQTDSWRFFLKRDVAHVGGLGWVQSSESTSQTNSQQRHFKCVIR